jgi:hypothetical protein
MALIERPLRWASTVLTILVLLGFVLFAFDKADAASKRQQLVVATADPTRSQEQAREQQNGRVKEAIYDIDDVLLKPFAGVTKSSDPWVRRGVPTGIAVVVYGFGLGFLASFARGRFR